MSETLTIRELRDILEKLQAFDGDYTTVTEVRIHSEFKRVHVVADFEEWQLTEENRSLLKAKAQLRVDIDAKKQELLKLTTRLAVIRNQRRQRAPQLP